VDPNSQKEQFSNAFVQAITAAAGFAISKPGVDDDSIDWQIAASGGQGTMRSPRLEIQLKCRTGLRVSGGEFRLPLKVKNFSDLVPMNLIVPRLLVLVIVPVKVSEWLMMDQESLLLRNCAYWVSLRGWPASENDETETVGVPTSQQFDVESLTAIMDRIGNGGLP